jgi:hypothetical protein
MSEKLVEKSDIFQAEKYINSLHAKAVAWQC